MNTAEYNREEHIALLENKVEQLQQMIGSLNAKIDAIEANTTTLRGLTERAVREIKKSLTKIDAMLRPTAEIGELLIEAAALTKIKGLNPKSISANKTLAKFTEPSSRRILLRLTDACKIKPRRSPAKD